MTRFLSESLQAPEPLFQLGLRQLEAANGHPGADIRLTTEVMQATGAKLRALGLDSHDTTAQELYQALQERVKADDARLTKTLRWHAALHVSADGDVVAGMIHVLTALPDSKRCFALKSGSLKALLKRQPPKRAMKQLGYRSLASCLKHETAVSLMTAASLCESPQWQARFREQYKALQSTDFENRDIVITQPTFKYWRELAASVVARQRHNILSLKELGTLVLLPLPADIPSGTVTASLVLALHELNEIRAGSTFLKLSQVRSDFGALVQAVAANGPQLHSELLGRPLSWNLIQHYYSRFRHDFSVAVFEPHIQSEDIAWYPIEKTLTNLEPSLAFWHRSGHLALLHPDKPVSLNIVDAALNHCNQLPFEQRVVHYFQRSLWHELLLRYLRHEAVEQTMIAELQPKLAAETVLT